MVNQNQNIMTKSDLRQLGGLYYVGHLIDMDGSRYSDDSNRIS